MRLNQIVVLKVHAPSSAGDLTIWSEAYLHDGDSIANDSRLAHHNACAMIQEDASAELSGRMDVYSKHFREAALEQERHDMPATGPQRMGEAIQLDGVVALKVQESLRVALASGILQICGSQ